MGPKNRIWNHERHQRHEISEETPGLHRVWLRQAIVDFAV
jgi:hypothetical protein